MLRPVALFTLALGGCPTPTPLDTDTGNADETDTSSDETGETDLADTDLADTDPIDTDAETDQADTDIVDTDLSEPMNAHSLAFDGVDDHLLVALDTGSWSALTVELWVRPERQDVIETWMGKGYSETFDAWSLGHDSQGQPQVSVRDTLSGAIAYGSASLVPLNTWTHVALVCLDDGYPKLYVNGSLIATSFNYAEFLSSELPIRIGGGNALDGGSHRPFQGRLDEVRVWSVARSPSELASDKDRTLTGAEPNLELLLSFEENWDDRAADHHTLSSSEPESEPLYSTDVPF